MAGINKMGKFSNYKIAIFLIAAISLFVYSCDSGGDEFSTEQRGLNISIKCPGAQGQNARDLNETLNDVMVVDVLVSGGNPGIPEIFDEFDAQSGSMTVNVPVGKNRVFQIFGKDDERNNICTGTTVADVDFAGNTIVISCDLVSEICFDGIDNDFNGLTDCEDPQCTLSSCDEFDPFVNECINSLCQDPQNPQENGDDDDSTDGGEVPAGDDDDDDSTDGGEVPAGDDDDDDSGNNSPVILCHIPPGNLGNPITIQVGAEAVPAHLNHGDSLGSCPDNGSNGDDDDDDGDNGQGNGGEGNGGGQGQGNGGEGNGGGQGQGNGGEGNGGGQGQGNGGGQGQGNGGGQGQGKVR